MYKQYLYSTCTGRKLSFGKILFSFCFIDGVCRNTISNCAEYGGKGMCQDEAYAAWAKSHCAEYCGFCASMYLVKGVTLPDNST